MPASTTQRGAHRRRVVGGPRRTVQLLLAWGGCLFGFALLTAIISPSGAAGDVPRAGGNPAQVQQAGAALYQQSCASCHGAGGAGTAAGPSLLGVGAASVDFYLSTGRMPLSAPGQAPQRQTPIFDPAQIAALVQHVAAFGPGPSVPQVTQGGDVHRGWQLYQANCAACHGASGSGNAVGGGTAAASLGRADDLQIAEAMLIGPGVMPRFGFAGADRDAIVAYVASLRTTPDPGGLAVGGIGPVAEGFVAVVIGLLAVLITVRFVGRRSHEGEPAEPLPLGDDQSPGDAP
jgi:ubiquinol-cytochrome c reductase cytochrome c subunit